MTADLEEVRRELTTRLPPRVRWTLDGTPWDWDFSLAKDALQPLAEADAESWREVLPDDWRQLHIFGDNNYAGGANPFLAVHTRTGEVFAIDIERDDTAVYFLNSTVTAFIDTFLLFDEVLGARRATPAGLADRVRAADPAADRGREWRDLITYIEELSADA